jgi:hypothetical protein
MNIELPTCTEAEEHLTDHSKIARAEASFKAVQKDDKQDAREQYEADQSALREKTARLRALRLARDAAQAANTTPPARRIAKRNASAGATRSNLPPSQRRSG